MYECNTRTKWIQECITQAIMLGYYRGKITADSNQDEAPFLLSMMMMLLRGDSAQNLSDNELICTLLPCAAGR